jgi:hypothetical protein
MIIARVLRASAVMLAFASVGEARALDDIRLDRAVFPINPMAAALASAWPLGEFAAVELGGKVVKGAPYTAEAVSETVQALADGNRIVRKNLTRLARDGEGRTRQERVVDGRTASVFINDVVAGRSWALNPEARRATELPSVRMGRRDGVPDAPAPGASTDEMRSWAESMREWAREFGARFRAEPMAGEGRAPNEQRVTRISVTPSTDGQVQREVEVNVVRVAEPPASAGAPPVPPVPPAPHRHPLPPLPMMLPPPGDGVTTALGSREFDGVRADGSRTTWVIPAGRIGNEKPIEIVSERWYAPDLMLVVATRRSDPRSGETSYRLTNLKRGEPDAALFKVPADYEIRARERRADKAERK